MPYVLVIAPMLVELLPDTITLNPTETDCMPNAIEFVPMIVAAFPLTCTVSTIEPATDARPMTMAFGQLAFALLPMEMAYNPFPTELAPIEIVWLVATRLLSPIAIQPVPPVVLMSVFGPIAKLDVP